MIEALRGVEVCVTQMAPLTEKVLDASPDLRLFCVSRGGPVNANLDAATARGVAVTFAPGRNATATAEHSVAMLLATTRRIPQTHADLASGTWRGDYYRYDAVGPELEDSTVGLIGYGAIGSRVARMLAGFGARVLAYDPYARAGGLRRRRRAGRARRAAVPLALRHPARPRDTGEQRDDRRGADRPMPPGSVLVNCARGALLDYDAACDALDSGHLFGAAFDVFAEEPIPAGSRLLRTPNVVLTPHLAGGSQETAQRAAAIVAADVGRYLRGEELAHCANPERREQLCLKIAVAGARAARMRPSHRSR